MCCDATFKGQRVVASRMLRWFLGAALFFSGCGYDCVAKCRDVEAELINSFGVSAQTVCTQEAFADANSCEACDEAFATVYSVRLAVGACGE